MRPRTILLTTFLCLFVVSAPAASPQIDPAKEADIRRLLAAQGGEETLARTMQQVWRVSGERLRRNLERQFPPELVTQIMDAFLQELTARFSVEYEDILIPIYDKYYTHEEIKELIQFSESPIGQRSVEVTPQIMGEIMAAISHLAPEIGQQAFEEVKKQFPQLRIKPNQALAVANLRTINTALMTHFSTYPQCGYPDSLADLGPGDAYTPQQSGMLDEVMAADTFTKNGYEFTYTLTEGVGDCAGEPGTDFTIVARPIEYGKTGRRSFFTDSTMLIRGTDEDRPATADDPPL